MTLPGALISLALLFVLAGPLLARLVLYSPDRARAIKIAEAQPPAVMTQLIRLYAPPELHRAERLDRHDAYVWQQCGLWCYSWGVILASAPNSNLSALSFGTQSSLGVCLMIGTTLTLFGSSLGLRLAWFGDIVIARRITENMTSDMLGDDIRLPYALGWAGLLSSGVSMLFYAGTVFKEGHGRLVETLGGAVSAAAAGMCISLSIKFIRGARRYVRDRSALIVEAVGRIERENGS